MPRVRTTALKRAPNKGSEGSSSGGPANGQQGARVLARVRDDPPPNGLRGRRSGRRVCPCPFVDRLDRVLEGSRSTGSRDSPPCHRYWAWFVPLTPRLNVRSAEDYEDNVCLFLCFLNFLRVLR